MSILIEPNYDLFIQILFVLWLLKGIMYFVAGVSRMDKIRNEKCGSLEIVVGIAIVLISAWILL